MSIHEEFKSTFHRVCRILRGALVAFLNAFKNAARLCLATEKDKRTQAVCTSIQPKIRWIEFWPLILNLQNLDRKHRNRRLVHSTRSSSILRQEKNVVETRYNEKPQFSTYVSLLFTQPSTWNEIVNETLARTLLSTLMGSNDSCFAIHTSNQREVKRSVPSLGTAVVVALLAGSLQLQDTTTQSERYNGRI